MLYNAKWITFPTGDYKGLEDKYGNPAPYFRHTFSLKKKVTKAELLASAMGVYKFYINGQAISDDYFAPGWVDYGKKMPFIRYDVTKFLEKDNGIGVVLGDGWAVGHVGSNTTFKRTSWSDQIELSAQLQITYEDGTRENIDTGSHWKATTGEILRTDIYMGEYVDHRLDLGDFSQYDYNDTAWDQAQETTFRFPRGIYLEEMTLAPIVVKHTFKPTLIKQDGNSFIYDVSQNISGVLRCVFKGQRGTKIKIRHGELMVNDALYTENLRKAEATDYYILSGEGDEVFRPLFTFHGFRFAEITVMGNAEIVDVTAEAMYTDSSNIKHCLLVLNKNGEDGIIVYSAGQAFATYSAHIPYAREIYRLIQYPELDEFNAYMERTVDKYVLQAKANNQNGIYRLLVDDIRSEFGDSLFNENVFLNVMQTRPEFEYVEFDGEEYFFKVEQEYANMSQPVSEKEMYPKGTRIELNVMNDPFAPVPSGTRGTVDHVDDMGQIHMRWDNGRTLALVPGEDSFRKLTNEEIIDELREQGRIVNLGDECEIILPEEPIDCSSMTYFDNLEYDCWDLVEKYCEHLGIQMIKEDGEDVVSFDIVKDIQERILDALEDAGVELNFERQQSEDSGMTMGGM